MWVTVGDSARVECFRISIASFYDVEIAAYDPA